MKTLIGATSGVVKVNYLYCINYSYKRYWWRFDYL